MTDESWETGLIGGTEKTRINLVEYDAGWPNKFKTHAARIAAALGAVALRIEHIGSTSVPGLAAKPVVDILVVVQDSTDETAYLPPLEKAGYVLRVREPHWHEHRMFRTPERDVTSTSTPPAVPRFNATSASAIDSAPTPQTVSATSKQSVSSPRKTGRT